MIDEVQLSAVQWIREETQQDYARQRVAGLEGTLHQRIGRRSHRVALSGLLGSEAAADDLKALQEKATSGDEVTFSADISTALAVEKMVIESFAAHQAVGGANQFAYTVVLAESPPLPPPAEVQPFGGLGDFGLGDLGFDPGALGDVLGDIVDQAGDISRALDAALDAAQAVEGLAGLADIGDIGNPLAPITEKLHELEDVGPAVTGLVDGLRGLMGEG